MHMLLINDYKRDKICIRGMKNQKNGRKRKNTDKRKIIILNFERENFLKFFSNFSSFVFVFTCLFFFTVVLFILSFSLISRRRKNKNLK